MYTCACVCLVTYSVAGGLWRPVLMQLLAVTDMRRLTHAASLPAAPAPAPPLNSSLARRHVVVAEVEAVPLPPGGDDNPHRNGFRMVETELTRVAAASRNHNFNTARHW